jgi:hypothetical protein
LEDGREVETGNKYKNAVTKNVPIFTEKDFENFIRKKSGNDDFQLSARRNGLLDAIPEVAPIKEEEVKTSAVPCDMWTERYKPKNVYDLIGNKAVID